MDVILNKELYANLQADYDKRVNALKLRHEADTKEIREENESLQRINNKLTTRNTKLETENRDLKVAIKQAIAELNTVGFLKGADSKSRALEILNKAFEKK